MRDYAKVTPRFWIGKTGRALRGHQEAQIVATYLITSPHANMIGMYHLPIAYIANDTGLSLEGATKGLHRALEAGIGAYDFDAEVVWVFKMAEYQIDSSLSPNDNRVKGIEREYSNVPENKYLSAFYDMYSKAFCMSEPRGYISPLQAPCKPLRSQEQEQEQEQNQETEQKQVFFVPAQPKRKKKQSITETAEPQSITSAARAWSILVKRMTDQQLPEDEEKVVSTSHFQEAVKMVGGGKYLSKLEHKYLPSIKKDFIAAYNQASKQ